MTDSFKRKKLNIMALEKRLMLDASLPAIAGQVLWLDASDQATIIDADGDNAATGTGGNNDGFSGNVATWLDKSSSNFDVSASGTEQPLYGSDTQNGLDVITFDGSNDRLTSAVHTIPGDDVSMFVVYNRTSTTGRDAVFELGSNSTSRNGIFLFADNTLQHYSSGQFRTLGGTYALGSYHLASFIHDTTAINGWMNGNTVLSTTTNTRASTTSITVGDDVTSGDEMTGTVAEVLVYDRDLTSDERHDIETYLAGKWGLTITNTDPVLDTNTGLTVDEGATITIDNTMLSSSDADNSDSGLIYTMTTDVGNGLLRNTNTALTLGVGDTFTQGDIDNGYIQYTHDGGPTTSDSFIFDITDQYGSVSAQTFSITINQIATLADIQAIPNAILHYDATDIDSDGDVLDQPADGSLLSTWTDGAGTAENANGSGGSRPTFVQNAFGWGIGGLSFDGTDDILTIGTTTDINNSTFTEKAFAFTFRTGSDVVSDQLIYEQGGGTHGFNFGIFGGNLYAHQYRSGASISYAIDLGAVTANTTYQVIANFDSGANTWSANVNGSAYTTIATSGTMPSHSGGPGLGNENGSTRHPVTTGSVSGLDFAGNLGEFWLWNHSLTSTEMADIDTYFFDKWYDTAHSLDANTTLNVQESTIVTITSANLLTTDLESPDTAITYTVTGTPTQGTLLLNGVALAINDTFTQDDITNGFVTYDHDGTPAPGADSFDFTVTDGFNPPIAGTFSINVTTLTTFDPVLVLNNAMTVDEGNTITVTSADLLTTDLDTADTLITYTLTDLVDNGTLYRNAVALGLGDSFTQDDITNNLITYTHDDSEIFTDSFEFTLDDGGAALGPYITNFIVNPVNDQTPTNITLSSNNVNENVSNNTLIGTLGAVDADLPGDSFTYSIVSDPDNKFQISGDQLRTAGALNREASATHSVTIRVNDGVHTYDRAFTIFVNDVNENPTDIAIDNTTITENSAIGTGIANLSATDPDLPGDSFTYTITSDPDNVFQIVGNQLQVGGAMDFETSASHTVSIRVNDGNGGQRTESFTITVTDINDVPILTVGDDPVVGQGNTVALTTAMLSATDVDNADVGLIYTLGSLPSNGTLTLNGTALAVNDAFTQQDIIDGNVVYEHNDAASGQTDSFDVTVSDGFLTTAADTVDVAVNPSRVNLNTVTVAEGGTTLIDSTDLNYVTQDTGWYDSNWSYRQKITIDSALIDSDLTDYPLLINETGLGAAFWSNVKADGSDIIITSADGLTKLDRELVSINTVGEMLQLYARTDLSSTTDTEFYIYYGNAAALETNSATTWRSEYTGVWHFDDDFSDSQADDSSQAANHGFAGNGFDNTNSVTGLIGQAAEFNNNEYLALNYSYSGNNSLPEISVSAWINTTENSGGQNSNWSIIDFDRSDFFNVFIHGNGELSFSTAGSGFSLDDQQSTGVTVNDGAWHHVTAVYDGTDKILYVDGTEVHRQVNIHSGNALGSGTRYGFIGDGSEASSFDAGRNNVYYDGLFDNIRLYEGTTDAAWISAEYENHANIAAFYSVDSQEIENGETTYTLQSAPANGILFSDTITINGVLDAGEELGIGDSFTGTDIQSNLIYYTHDNGESTTDGFSFIASDALGNNTVSQNCSFAITPVNDAPTGLTINPTFVNENAANGSPVGHLSTVDVDLPGDSFTYTILSDPDNKFQIVGNQLRVAGSLDFELAESHDVTIRTDDGNGGTFDQTFTISIRNLADDTVIPQSDERNPSFRNFDISTDLIGNPIAHWSLGALLLDEGLLLNNELPVAAANNDFIPVMDNSSGIEPLQTNNNGGDVNHASQENYTTLRQALAFLMQSDHAQAGVVTEIAEASRAQSFISEQFKEILHYHEISKERLREALYS